MNVKTCVVCGDTFTPKNGRQKTCHHDKTMKCPVCDKTIHYKCGNKPVTCSNACASKYVKPGTVKKCSKCGREFAPKTPRQIYCGKPVKSNCIVCGKEFTYPCGSVHIPTTCGLEECKLKSKSIRREKKDVVRECPLCHKKFHPVNNTQKYCRGKHYFTCVVCGEEFYESIEEIKLNNGIPRKTCSKECLAKLHSKQTLKRDKDKVNEKIRQTCLKKYGVESASQSNEVKKKCLLTSRRRYGTDYPLQCSYIRSNQARSARRSLLEVRVSNLLSQYNVEFEQQYVISKDGHTHAFDFYVPKYKILVDADGKYYHAYLSDPDGKHVRDDYDDVRMYLVPEDHIFILAVEGNEEKAVKQVYKTIKQMDEGVYDYEGELFRWCRSIGFPYPQYTAERMKKDWEHLCLYENGTYKPTCRLGMSIVSNFHRSVYDCRVGRCRSVKEAWEDNVSLKRVIANRLVYQNTVNPSKVLKGFNVCKKAPVVSRFNPVLAKYLTKKYMDEFDEVFDPFSGFSGRLLGVASCGKKYTGQDIRRQAVEESNQIIKFLNLSKCSVSQQDVLQSLGTYDCLLTCPPYSNKETYGGEVCYKSCDEWIDECLKRFKCRKYVFVVDETEEYKDFAVEEVQNSSHFSKAVERVVVLSS